MGYKKLRRLPDQERLDGFSYIYGRTSQDIYINVERLWNRAAKSSTKAKHKTTEDYFAQYFSDTYTHEVLHFVLRKFYRPALKWEFGEELVIWSLLNEKIPKASLKFYENSLQNKIKITKKYINTDLYVHIKNW